MTTDTHAHPPYVKIWIGLLLALIISLVIGEIWSNELAVASIFAIALVKAGVVLNYFMHLKFAPRWLKLTGAGAVAVVAILYIGLVPDIQHSYSAISEAPGTEQADDTHAGSAPGVAADTAAATTPAQSRGKVVYSTYCVACHQADGRGMNGMLAADFIGDKSRLAKSDELLIKSIADGMSGSIGQMPPWGGVLNEGQQSDVLAYIRGQFGGSQ